MGAKPMRKAVKASGLTRRRKVLYTLAVLALAALVIESCLYVLGLFPPDSPFALSVDEHGRQVVAYNWNRIQPAFHPQKPPGRKRIVIAGGSTAMGFPFHPRSSFAKRLEAMLSRSLSGADIEVINLAREGMSSRDVKLVLERAMEYQPDLALVYTGHNEFISLPSPPLPYSFLNVLESFRLGRALARGIKVLAGAGALAVMKAWERDPDAPVELPAPERVSGDDYQRVVRDFVSSLEGIIATCRSNNVQTVLCTAASNLAGWPPEQRAAPPGMSQKKLQFVREKLEKAEGLLNKGSLSEAMELTKSARQEAPGYAPVFFMRAMIKAEAGKNGDKELKKDALWDFKKALALEAKTVVTHRAPPDINAVVRETARSKGAWLMDTVLLFERNSRPPGFEWFMDHCHPGLEGQQIIAHALYELLKEKGWPRPGDEWKEAREWDEQAFRNAQGIDREFLHKVHLRTGIFLGLQKELPEKSRATMNTLEKARENDPHDPLPQMVQAAVALHHQDAGKAGNILSALYKSDADKAAKAMDRYFTSALDLRQGVFMMRPGEPGAPPLRGLMKSGLFKGGEAGAGSSGAGPGLERYSVFLDLESGGEDISDFLSERLDELSRSGAGERRELFDAQKGVLMDAGPGARLEEVSEAGTYNIEGAGAFLSSGRLELDPLAYLELRIRCERTGSEAGPVRVTWNYTPWRRGDIKSAGAEVKCGGGEAFTLHLAGMPRWVIGSRVFEIRAYPGLYRGSFELYWFELE